MLLLEEEIGVYCNSFTIENTVVVRHLLLNVSLLCRLDLPIYETENCLEQWWARAGLHRLPRASCAHFFPAPSSMPSHWYHESATVGIVTPQKWANTANRAILPAEAVKHSPAHHLQECRVYWATYLEALNLHTFLNLC